ncbi:putative biofilm formation methyltransferase WspC [Massilia sp. Bi118]|uniref:CheR family methyltransferase n=1 Tax=Massilia sp. Bi118 TaxID=2822346 RepID=UPI001D732D81|nr:CheR family methyltransferase [Massilia sp. Bi118]CAH0286507.1 putative biofilm formation methyltransferase WspC [Massilia sp. Bi118]
MNLHQLLKSGTGLVLPGETVERAVRERMLKLGLSAREDYAPLPGTPEFEALVDLVTVPESWMFRDPEVFETALRFVQRRLLSHPGRQLAILSLPCAGGEEPYSMAMALAHAGIDPAQCRIDAVDLSQAAVERARLGRYTRNAFRGAGLAFRERWFRKDGNDDGDAYLIGEAPRRYVRFSQGNLLKPAALAQNAGRYDLVFCRNLLIYFDEPGRAAAAAAIQALLLDDGLLLSGCAEAPAFCRGGFAPQSPGIAYALQKQALATVRLRPRPAPMAAPKAEGARPAVKPQAARAPRETARAPAAATVGGLIAQARQLADAGRLPDADRACQQALALQPGLAEAWFLLGLISEAGGEPRAAERHLRRCLYLQPEHYEALCSLALLREQRGDASDADLLRRRAARVHARDGKQGATR